MCMKVVEALSLPAALKLVSACCGKDIQNSDEDAVKVSPPCTSTYMYHAKGSSIYRNNKPASSTTNPTRNRSSNNVGVYQWL